MDGQRTVLEIDATIREMDKQYDANFGEWVRTEDNVDILAASLKKYLHEYSEDIFAEVLKWITEHWTLPCKVTLMKKLFGMMHSADSDTKENEIDDRSKLASNRVSAALYTKYIVVLRLVIQQWSVPETSALIVEFITDMDKNDKKAFLHRLLDGYNAKKVTEVFIRIDNIVDWSLKISIIKGCKREDA